MLREVMCRTGKFEASILFYILLLADSYIIRAVEQPTTVPSIEKLKQRHITPRMIATFKIYSGNILPANISPRRLASLRLEQSLLRENADACDLQSSQASILDTPKKSIGSASRQSSGVKDRVTLNRQRVYSPESDSEEGSSDDEILLKRKR